MGNYKVMRMRASMSVWAPPQWERVGCGLVHLVRAFIISHTVLTWATVSSVLNWANFSPLQATL